MVHPARMMMIGGVLPLLAVGVGGCANVNPKQDYQRASALIAERTGITEALEASTDEVVGPKVDALLSDGLTVDEAIRVALLNNRSFQALFQTIGASRADVVQSALLTNPSVTLMARIPVPGGRTKWNVDFAQELVELWQIPVRKKIAHQQLEQTILDVAQQAIALSADVKARSYELLAVRRAEATAQKHFEVSEQSLKLAQDRFKVGETSEIDVKLTQAGVLSIQLEALVLERDRQVAAAALGRALGLSRTSKPVELKDALPKPGGLRPDEMLVAFAVDNRIDAQIRKSQVAAAEQQLMLELRRRFPSVVLGPAWEQPTKGPSLLGPFVQFTLPIWDQNQAQIAKARFLLTQRRKEYEDLLDTIALDVQHAAAVARSAETQVLLYEQKILPLANENVVDAGRLYKAGERDIVTVIEAQDALIIHQRQYETVLRDYALAMTGLERSVGGRLPAPATSQAQADAAPTPEAPEGLPTPEAEPAAMECFGPPVLEE